MGLTRVTTKLTGMTVSGKCYEAVFLVDTGATDCMAPADELEMIGVAKEGRMSYELAAAQSRSIPSGWFASSSWAKRRPAGSSSGRPGPNRFWASRPWNRLASWSTWQTRR